jgi:hypothetical protein
VLTRDADAERWALVRYNLALTCTRHPKGDGDETLDRAISYFEEALPVLGLVRPPLALNTLTHLGRQRRDLGQLKTRSYC